MGEVAAACVAGALSLEDAARILCCRSRLLRRVSGHGAMALVELSRREAEELLRGREHSLSVAVCNSERSTVVSGDPAAIDGILAATAGQKGDHLVACGGAQTVARGEASRSRAVRGRSAASSYFAAALALLFSGFRGERLKND
jgi:acyl transferase domain-containing protein